MEELVSSIVDKLIPEDLTRAEASEAIFYIDYLLKRRGTYEEANRLLNIKIKVQKRIIDLDRQMLVELKKAN